MSNVLLEILAWRLFIAIELGTVDSQRVRPTEITTNMAFQSGSNYVVQGYFDRDGSTTFFNCWFGLDGRFIRLS